MINCILVYVKLYYYLVSVCNIQFKLKNKNTKLYLTHKYTDMDCRDLVFIILPMQNLEEFYVNLPLQINYAIMEEELSYSYKYPHAAITMDNAVFGYDGEHIKVLLIQRGNEPYQGFWAFPGGFLNMDETTEQGALRELKEETGITVNECELFGVFSDVDRDPRERVVTIGYLSIIKLCDVNGGDDAVKAQWFDLEQIPELAFDHDKILQSAVKKLKELNCQEEFRFDLSKQLFSAAEKLHVRILIDRM